MEKIWEEKANGVWVELRIGFTMEMEVGLFGGRGTGTVRYYE